MADLSKKHLGSTIREITLNKKYLGQLQDYRATSRRVVGSGTLIRKDGYITALFIGVRYDSVNTQWVTDLLYDDIEEKPVKIAQWAKAHNGK